MTRRPTIPLPSPRDQSHRYRFHGRNRPQDRTRTPVYDQAAAAVADGVATLRIYDPIDSWGGDWGISAKEFVNALDAIGDVGEIQLQINSPGGEVFEALAIMNVLRAHPARVVARVDGLAASAASFIAASADELVMQPNSELMIHDGWGICVGNAADMHQTGDLLDHLSDNIASVYAEKSGGKVEDWRQLMLAETWFSADEAVTSGLADRIYRAGDTAPSDPPADQFDLAGLFQHAGRADAPPPALPVEDHAVDRGYAARHAANRHKLTAARHGLKV
jgi:ATP-dependent protease ClpP protease subunit